MSWYELNGSTVDGFVGVECGESSNSEELVGCSVYVTYLVVGRRCDEVPVCEVASGIDDGVDVSRCEVAPLNDGA